MREKGTHPLHPEPSTSIHHLEEIVILFASKPIQPCNLEIAPEMTHVVGFPFHVVGIDIVQVSLAWLSAHNLLWQWLVVFVFLLFILFFLFGLLLIDKHLPETLRGDISVALEGRRIPEDVWHGLAEFLDGNGEAISLVVSFHFDKGITANVSLIACSEDDLLSDVAKVLDLRFQTPVPLVLVKQRMLVEESAFVSFGHSKVKQLTPSRTCTCGDNSPSLHT
jgi:hypothetical protein